MGSDNCGACGGVTGDCDRGLRSVHDAVLKQRNAFHEELVDLRAALAAAERERDEARASEAGDEAAIEHEHAMFMEACDQRDEARESLSLVERALAEAREHARIHHAELTDAMRAATSRAETAEAERDAYKTKYETADALLGVKLRTDWQARAETAEGLLHDAALALNEAIASLHVVSLCNTPGTARWPDDNWSELRMWAMNRERSVQPALDAARSHLQSLKGGSEP